MRHVFLDRFVFLLNVAIRIFSVEKVHTHQFDVLSIHQDRGGDGTFVDVLSVNDSFSPSFAQHNPSPVFVVVFFQLRPLISLSLSFFLSVLSTCSLT